MNRGDEAGGPGEEHGTFVPALPDGPDRPEPGEPHFAVVISGDGTADIGGVPVPVPPGEALDVAILDMLHERARGRGASVTAAISDPSAGYVAIVEVRPDGSSKLVEQRAQDADDDAPAPVVPAGPVVLDKPTGQGESPDQDAASGTLGAAAPSGPAAPPPAAGEPEAGPLPSRGRRPGRRRESQSDDEFQRPGLFQRPLGLGIVAVSVVTLVIGSLVAVASGSDGGTEQNRAANADENADEESGKPEMSLRPPGPTRTPSSSPSPSESPSRSPSASSSPSKSPSPSPSSARPTSRQPETEAPEPERPKPAAGGGPRVPTGEVLIRNQKYGYCVDVPGGGKGKPRGPVNDEPSCIATSRDNQLWTLERKHRGDGTGGADLYLIRNVKDRLCLDLPGAGPAPLSAGVQEDHCDGGKNENQLWWFDKRSNGTFWIRNQQSGDMCLDVSRTDPAAGDARLTIYPCNDHDDHQWRFEKS
ncbi:RICIN domain-containing protein [Streptomyces sp. NPDC004134]|uniref:RICIN domain-containing protein n=1 Tax=Streptomyces sp. NPDC004134 TaxID=3364691 RepID=UPI0036773623